MAAPMGLMAGLALAVAGAGAETPRLGIVTMHTPDILSYANSTESLNRRYAERWGYGFHVLDHVIDTERLPHWSKLHAMQIFLPEYDYLFWIDADAAFMDLSKSIEEAVGLTKRPDAELFIQDIWPDYPSLHRNELMDTGMFLMKNSRWSRQLLVELYHLPACLPFLNWTEQFCFTAAYRSDLLGMRQRTAILPTPALNHHVLPPPGRPGEMFVLHLAGRPTRARLHHFKQVHEGRAADFAGAAHAGFWRFRELFAKHRFGGVAALQACIFGAGPRHRDFLDALLFHFPYMGAFSLVRGGAPGLWSAMKASEEVADRFPRRVAHVDLNEYLAGRTRDGDDFVQGFFCDIVVLGTESWRHLPSLKLLGRLATSGLEPLEGDSAHGFGYSPLRDVYFVWLQEGCEQAAGSRLDSDDEDGSALLAACSLLQESQEQLRQLHAGEGPAAAVGPEGPVFWKMEAPGERGFSQSGDVVLARLRREAFVE